MSITAITIENFKSIKEPVRIEFKPITLLFGPNSAGKSTIIQALHYAHELLTRGNADPNRTLLGGDVVDLGGFSNFVHGHDRTRTIVLTFELDLTNDDLYEYVDWFEEDYVNWSAEGISDEVVVDANDISNVSVAIHISWLESENRPLVRKCNIDINNELFATIEASTDGKQVFVQNFNHRNLIFHEFDKQSELVLQLQSMQEEGIEFNLATYDDVFDEDDILSFPPFLRALLELNRNRATFQATGKKPTPLLGMNEQLEVTPFDGLENINREVDLLNVFLTAPIEFLRQKLNKLLYVGPLRDVPSRNFTPDKFPAKHRWANGLAAWDYLYNAPPAILMKINNWLADKHRLNCGYSVKAKEYLELEWTADTDFDDKIRDHFLDMTLTDDEKIDAQATNLPMKKRLFLWEEKNQIEVAPQDIGVGISQVLPVVVAAIKAREGIVLVEQPELHIHPALQVSLGDLFIEQVRDSLGLNFIIETHSEHLILRILRRIRETASKELPDNIPPVYPADVAVHYIQAGENGSEVIEIPITEDGDFSEEWPAGFFEERDDELFL